MKRSSGAVVRERSRIKSILLRLSSLVAVAIAAIVLPATAHAAAGTASAAKKLVGAAITKSVTAKASSHRPRSATKSSTSRKSVKSIKATRSSKATKSRKATKRSATLRTATKTKRVASKSKRSKTTVKRHSRKVKTASTARSSQKKAAKKASAGKRASSKKSVASGKSRGGVTWVANQGCLAGNLRSIIYAAAARFGAIRVNSTCRSAGHNRRVGGASKSWHLTGNAADIRVFGNISAAAAFLRASARGFKHYGGGLFHIDNGPKRSW